MAEKIWVEPVKDLYLAAKTADCTEKDTRAERVANRKR
jgi:hypothetical protein